MATVDPSASRAKLDVVAKLGRIRVSSHDRRLGAVSRAQFGTGQRRRAERQAVE